MTTSEHLVLLDQNKSTIRSTTNTMTTPNSSSNKLGGKDAEDKQDATVEAKDQADMFENKYGYDAMKLNEMKSAESSSMAKSAEFSSTVAGENDGEKVEGDMIDVVHMSSGRIMKNIIMMSTVFFLNFVAYGGLSGLQSSLHLDEGMGTTTQSLLYATMLVSCLFLPKLAIQTLGHKRCVSVSLLGYMVWMAANGYAVWGTMIPASMLVGICAAPLWTAQCSYMTVLGQEYARLTGQPKETVINLFFGIFFMFFQCNGILGSVISSTVLKQAPPENYTGPTDDELAMCGINDCPGNNVTNANLAKPADSLVWTLVGIYICIAITGFIVSCLFIDDIPKPLLPEEKRGWEGTKDALKATVIQAMRPMQLLLIPITVFSGLEQTFKGADWNKSYVACYLGMWMIGYSSMAFAITDAFTSFFGGKISKITGRIPLFVTGMILELLLVSGYMFLSPDPDEPAMFFVMPAMGGVADGIWQTQINALYGFLFMENPEAAFSNYRFWESSGFVMGYAYSSALCTTSKLYILLSALILGMLLYARLEYVVYRKSKQVAAITEVEAENIKGVKE